MATVPNIKTILKSNSNEHRKTIEFRIFHFSRNNQESTTIVKFNVNSLEHVSISQAFSFSQRKTLSDLTDLPKVLLQENTDFYRIISEAESLYTNMPFSFSGLAVCCAVSMDLGTAGDINLPKNCSPADIRNATVGESCRLIRNTCETQHLHTTFLELTFPNSGCRGAATLWLFRSETRVNFAFWLEAWSKAMDRCPTFWSQ